MNFESIFETLSNREPLAPLFPDAVWNKDLSAAIAQCEVSEPTRAGLLLWNDDLDASHNLSQSLETPTGSLWHAVMHRREGDASNSIYWWHRTGEHPAFARLYPRAVELLQSETAPEAQALLAALRRAGTWLPIDFVHACQTGAVWCVQLQHEEFAAFLIWCHTQN